MIAYIIRMSLFFLFLFLTVNTRLPISKYIYDFTAKITRKYSLALVATKSEVKASCYIALSWPPV